VEGLTELGEGVRSVSKEEGMVVHVEGQGQAVGLEGTGEEVQVREEGFPGVKAGAGVVAGGIVQEVEQDLFIRAVGEERVRGGVVLPEGAQVTGLPAFDGLGRLFVAGVWGQVVFEGPAADAGAIGWEVEAAEQFAGASAVGGGGLGRQEGGELGRDFERPAGAVIPAGGAGSPELGTALGASAQILGVEFVEAGFGQVEFGLNGGRPEITGAELGQQMANKRRGQTLD
jgi:hypothetical protein